MGTDIYQPPAKVVRCCRARQNIAKNCYLLSSVRRECYGGTLRFPNIRKVVGIEIQVMFCNVLNLYFMICSRLLRNDSSIFQHILAIFRNGWNCKTTSKLKKKIRKYFSGIACNIHPEVPILRFFFGKVQYLGQNWSFFQIWNSSGVFLTRDPYKERANWRQPSFFCVHSISTPFWVPFLGPKPALQHLRKFLLLFTFLSPLAALRRLNATGVAAPSVMHNGQTIDAWRAPNLPIWRPFGNPKESVESL